MHHFLSISFSWKNKEKLAAISHDLSDNVVEENDHELRSKRNKKDTSFVDDIYTSPITDDTLSYHNIVTSIHTSF